MVPIVTMEAEEETQEGERAREGTAAAKEVKRQDREDWERQGQGQGQNERQTEQWRGSEEEEAIGYKGDQQDDWDDGFKETSKLQDCCTATDNSHQGGGEVCNKPTGSQYDEDAPCVSMPKWNV